MFTRHQLLYYLADLQKSIGELSKVLIGLDDLEGTGYDNWFTFDLAKNIHETNLEIRKFMVDVDNAYKALADEEDYFKELETDEEIDSVSY